MQTPAGQPTTSPTDAAEAAEAAEEEFEHRHQQEHQHQHQKHDNTNLKWLLTSMTYESGNASCQGCLPGTYSRQGATACTHCAAGKIAHRLRSTSSEHLVESSRIWLEDQLTDWGCYAGKFSATIGASDVRVKQNVDAQGPIPHTEIPFFTSDLKL